MESGATCAGDDEMIASRSFQRFYAIFGWRPLALLGIVILIFALVMDSLYSEYDELEQQIAGQEKKLRNMKAKIGQQKQLETALKEKQEKLLELSAKGFVAPTPEAAGGMLVGEMQNQVNGVRGKDFAGTPQAPDLSNGLALIRADVQFGALTQQFVALLDGLANSARVMRINSLEVSVPDTSMPNGLTVKAVVQGYAPAPQTPPKPAGK